MSFSFWNNPVVVSAFRVKHRRGGLSGGVTAYLLLLFGGSYALPRMGFQPLGDSWPLTYLVALVSIQCVLSGLMAGSATWNSMRAEVTQRTLDFQRVALAPRDILLGKMLGAPATAYLLAIATVPLGFVCAIAAGVSLGVVLLLYLTLATTILLCGTWGLRIHAEIPDRSPGRGITAVVCFTLYLMSIGFGGIGNMLAVPWASVPVGLLTPLPVIFGVATEDPSVGMKWFGIGVPFLFVTPLWQLLVASFFFHSMERHLRCPMNPPFSKFMVYLALVIVDGVTAGVLFDMGVWDLAPGPRAAAFCLVHLAATILLLLEATPDQDAIHSWVWRFRGRTSPLGDAFRGDRSPVGLMLLTTGAVGVVNLVLLVLLPAGAQLGVAAILDAAPVILSAAAVMVLLVLTIGMVLQVLLFEAGHDGAIGLWILLVPAVGIPHVAGAYFQLPWLLALSPSAWFVSWLRDDPLAAGQWRPARQALSSVMAYLPLLVMLYGSLLAVVWLYLRGRLQQIQREVDAKLRGMGVNVTPTQPVQPTAESPLQSPNPT